MKLKFNKTDKALEIDVEEDLLGIEGTKAMEITQEVSEFARTNFNKTREIGVPDSEALAMIEIGANRIIKARIQFNLESRL
jgi:hypothetical protein